MTEIRIVIQGSAIQEIRIKEDSTEGNIKRKIQNLLCTGGDS